MTHSDITNYHKVGGNKMSFVEAFFRAGKIIQKMKLTSQGEMTDMRRAVSLAYGMMIPGES